MYTNQEEYDKVVKELESLNAGLKVGSFGVINDDTVANLGITVPVKGNSKLIRKLKELGWEDTYRSKRRTDNTNYVRNQYSGYIMVQHMKYRMSIDK